MSRHRSNQNIMQYWRGSHQCCLSALAELCEVLGSARVSSMPKRDVRAIDKRDSVRAESTGMLARRVTLKIGRSDANTTGSLAVNRRRPVWADTRCNPGALSYAECITMSHVREVWHHSCNENDLATHGSNSLGGKHRGLKAWMKTLECASNSDVSNQLNFP